MEQELNEDKSNIANQKIELDESKNDSIELPTETMRNILTTVGSIVDTFNTSELKKTINVVLNAIYGLRLGDYLDSLNDTVNSFHEYLSDIIKIVTIPGLSQEEKQELVNSYIIWGSYGWTINPCSDFEKLLDRCPEDKKVADKLALKDASSKINCIIETIKSKKRVNKKDFAEAVENFNGKRYKSCALILFSLIDSKLIRIQGKSKIGGKRLTGNGALKILKKKTGYETDEITLLELLFYANLFSCIEKMFEYGNDFRNQPDVINRNFLCHGMMTRKVSKKDCIQLFLFYYNILEMMEMYYDFKNV